jgi:WD40 repeat protein
MISTSEPQALRLFVSYSRRDAAFADSLVDALKARGFVVLIDRRDLPKLEDWERELLDFIRRADTVIFLVSPFAVASKVVAWEIEQVRLQAKRLAPVVIGDVPSGSIPAEINRINYIFFNNDSTFDASIEELVKALNTDRAWIKEHTRIGELAFRWEDREKSDEGLLRGGDLDEADSWAASRPREAPVVTETQRNFLSRCREFETLRLGSEREQVARTRRFQRRSAWALSAVTVLVTLGLLATLMQSRHAYEREATVYSSLVHRAMKQGYYDRAMRLAVQGLPTASDLPWIWPRSPVLAAQLASAAMRSRLISQLDGKNYPVRSGSFSPRGQFVVTSTGGSAIRLWSVREPRRVVDLVHAERVWYGTVSADETRLFTASTKGIGRLWDVTGANILAEFGLSNRMFSGRGFSSDGARLLTLRDDRILELRTSLNGHLIAELRFVDEDLLAAEFSPDGKRVLTQTQNRLTLWDATDGSLTSELNGHANIINSASFSADSSRIVTASWDGTARIWDGRSGAYLVELKGHEDRVYGAQYSPNGQVVLTRSADRTARLWRAETGQLIATLTGHDDEVSMAIFSPESTIALTKAAGHPPRLWNAQTGGPIATLAGQTTKEIFSHDGARLAAVDDDKGIRLWAAGTGTVILSMRGEATVSRLSFSPDGSCLYVGWEDGTGQLYDTITGALVALINGHESTVSFAEFSSDGGLLLTGDDNGIARVWNASLHTSVSILSGHDGKVDGATFSSDGSTILTYSTKSSMPGLGHPLPGDRKPRVWTAGGALVHALTGHQDDVWDAVFSPDGKRVVTASSDKTARVWDTRTGSEICQLSGHDDLVRSIAFSPDGKKIATTSNDRSARIWQAPCGPQLAVLGEHGSWVGAVSFSSNGARVLTTSSDNKARIWDAESGRELTSVMPSTSWVALLTPDGERLITIDKASVRIWNANNGEALCTLDGHSADIENVQLSQDGRLLVTSSSDKTARIWSIDCGRELAVLKGHDAGVNGAEFSPDGTILLTYSVDGTARLWHIMSGLEIAVLTGHVGSISTARFSLDGSSLVTSSSDKTARIWDVSWFGGARGIELRTRACNERMRGAQHFTTSDAADPALIGMAGRNPCDSPGPLSISWWLRRAGLVPP